MLTLIFIPFISILVSAPAAVRSAAMLPTLSERDEKALSHAWSKVAPHILTKTSGLFGNRLLDTLLHEAILLLIEGNFNIIFAFHIIFF